MVPVWVNFLVAKGTGLVTMQVFKVSCKKYRSWIHATTICAFFIPSCQWHDLTLFQINKPSMDSEYNTQCLDKNSISKCQSHKMVKHT